MARLHRAADALPDYLLERLSQKNDIYLDERVDGCLLDFLRQERSKLESRLPSLPYASREQLLNALGMFFEDCAVSKKAVGIAKKVFLHRDFHGRNVLYDKSTGKLVAVTDFDDLCVGYQLFDLAFAVDSFSSDRALEKLWAPPDERLARGLIEEYLDKRPEALQEISQISSAARSEMCRMTAFFVLEKIFFGDDSVPERTVPRYLAWHNRLRALEKIYEAYK